MDKGKSRLESMEIFHHLVDFKMDLVSKRASVQSVCADEHNCDKKYRNRHFETLSSFTMATKCDKSLYFINIKPVPVDFCKNVTITMSI